VRVVICIREIDKLDTRIEVTSLAWLRERLRKTHWICSRVDNESGAGGEEDQGGERFSARADERPTSWKRKVNGLSSFNSCLRYVFLLAMIIVSTFARVGCRIEAWL